MTVKVRPYRRGGWEVDIRLRLPDGSIHRERTKSPVTSKTGSTRWGQDRERHLLQHGVPKPEEPKERVPTMEEFAEVYRAHARAMGRKPATLAHYERGLRLHVLPALGDVRLDEIDEPKLGKLRAQLVEAGNRPATVNLYTGLVVAMLGVAADLGLISEVKVKAKRLPNNPGAVEHYSEADLAKLLQAAEGISPELHLVVLLGAHAGLRRGEILALEWGDVDLKRGVITVARSDWQGQIGPTKSGKVRHIPMTSQLTEALKAHRHLQGPRVLYRLVNGATLPWGAKSLDNRLRRAQRLAGLVAKGPHILRHTFCSQLAAKGAPARVIQELAGHGSIRVTERYMHLAPGAAARAIALLERGDTVETGSGRRKKA